MTSMLALILLSIPLIALHSFAPVRRHWQATLFAFNVIFVLLVLNSRAVVYLIIFLLLSYVDVLLTHRYKKVPLILPVLAATWLFATLKGYDFALSLWPTINLPEMVGLSYIIFRILTVLFEVRDKDEVPSLTHFLNYSLLLFTLLAGPIQRYNRFKADMRQRTSNVLDNSIVSTSLNRLSNGTLKVVLIAPIFQSLRLLFWNAYQTRELPITRELHLSVPAVCFLSIASLLYLIFLYFNFSGYTDMVIALGRLAGCSLPENFDHPFKATSFLDFWSRWHTSLSFWFRDYCFSLVLKRSFTLGIRNSFLATLPAYFVSFALLGLWHGRTWPFLVCGLMFAVGSVMNQAYRSAMVSSRFAVHYKRISSAPWYCAVASALTLLYISIAIMGLWLSTPEIAVAWLSFVTAKAITVLVLVLMCVAFLVYMMRLAKQVSLVERISRGVVFVLRDCEASYVVAAKAFAVICWAVISATNVPDFVYRRF